MRILFIGLDAAGKTTILYQLKLGELVTTVPTVGYNKETIEHGSVNFTAWDVGVGDKTRRYYQSLLRHYYQSTKAVVFVIDSHDRERYREAVDVLQKTISDEELRDVPIVILANKQDLSDVMNREEILNDLMTNTYLTGRKWEVFAVSGTLGQGLVEGLDWLTAVLTNTVPIKEDLTHIEENNDAEASIEDVSK